MYFSTLLCCSLCAYYYEKELCLCCYILICDVCCHLMFLFNWNVDRNVLACMFMILCFWLYCFCTLWVFDQVLWPAMFIFTMDSELLCVCVCVCVWEWTRVSEKECVCMSVMWLSPVIFSLTVNTFLVMCHRSIYGVGTLNNKSSLLLFSSLSSPSSTIHRHYYYYLCCCYYRVVVSRSATSVIRPRFLCVSRSY